MKVAEFSRIPVGELVASGEAELKTGPFGTQLKASDYTENGTPVINVRNIGFGTIKIDKLEFISPATRDRLSSHILRNGDIVFGRKGAVERHVFIRKEQNGWFQGSDCLRLRFSSPRVEPLFASYCFLTKDHQRWMMNQCSHGATMASLNQGILERIELPLPPLSVQQRIASILSTYDDLIENSQRRIQILESMARNLYCEWFVKAPEENNWPWRTLGDLITLKRGYDLPERMRRPGPVEIVSSSGITGNHDKSKVTGPGLVTGRYGTLGEVHLVWDDFWPLNTSLYVVDFRGTPLLYAYWMLQSILRDQSGSAAAVPGLNRNHLHLLPVLRPPTTIMQKFHSMAMPMAVQTRVLQRQIHNLRCTRDLLLPRLLSGQLPLDMGVSLP